MRDVLLLHRAHEGGIVHALALGVEERPFEMDAEHARDACRERGAHGFDRLRHGLARIGDEGRQEARGAVAAVRRADGAMPSTLRSSLKSTPPPPFTCTSMKPGASSPSTAPALDAGAEILLPGTAAMRPSSITTARPSSMCAPSKIRPPVSAMVIRRSPSPCGGAAGCPGRGRAPSAGFDQRIEALDQGDRRKIGMHVLDRGQHTPPGLPPRPATITGNALRAASFVTRSLTPLKVSSCWLRTSTGKSVAGQRPGPVHQLGGAQRLRMDAAGLLELERGFLRDREADAAADDEEVVALPQDAEAPPTSRVAAALASTSGRRVERVEQLLVLRPMRRRAGSRRRAKRCRTWSRRRSSPARHAAAARPRRWRRAARWCR